MIARWFWREWRTPSLLIVWLALSLAVACVLALGSISDRMEKGLTQQSRDFLAGDRALRTSKVVAPEWLAKARELGLRVGVQLSFPTMTYAGDTPQLASVKAVDEVYPLYGELQTRPPELKPQPGTVLLSPRLQALLNLKTGDSIDVGDATLKVAGEVLQEPDAGFNPFQIAPRLMMNRADVAKTGAVQPGSRVTWRYKFAGAPPQITAYEKWLLPQLGEDQRWSSPESDEGALGKSLERSRQFLLLSALLTLLLAVAAVAVAMSHYCRSRYDLVAVLKTLGAGRAQLRRLIIGQWSMLLLLSLITGGAMGLLFEQVLLILLRPVLPAALPAASLWPWLWAIGAMTTISLLVGLRPYRLLLATQPLRVLRRDMLPVPPSAWLVYGTAIFALGLIMWRLSLDLKITLALLGGGLLATLLLGGLLLMGLKAMRRLLAGASLSWRLGLGQLLRHPLAAAGQALAFGLILLAMALIALLRGELLDTWQDQLPDNAPNHFVLNVLPAEKDAFAERIAAISDHAAPLYPVVPGRLIAINGEPVRQLVSKESQGERAIRRDLSLTWAAELPKDNHIVAGNWWGDQGDADIPGVSVEAELAQSLQLKVGDRLSFTIGGLTREASVTSLREVNWDSFQPNFYMIFEPDTLQGMPATYMTSFHLPPGKERELVELARAFPSVTLLQVEALLAQLRSILAQVSLAVEYVLLFVLAAGLAVLFAGLQATLDERIRQGALLRALGAERGLLLRARRAEFGLLGAASGLLAALGCELVSALLYHYAFDLRWQPHPWLLVLPLIGALLVGGAGLIGTRRALKASPLTVLRES